MYNINKDIENEIIDAINVILDEYLQGRTSGTSHAKNVLSRDDYDKYFDGKVKTIFDAKREFKTKVKQLIKDIKYVGYRNFSKISGGDTAENQQKYRDLVSKLLNDIIQDRIAVELDKTKEKVMENVKNFDKYFEGKIQKLYEVNLPVMKLEEILDDVTQVTNDTLKRVLVSYFKTYDDYIDLSDKKKHFFKVHDMVGDIMNNNRVSFDVCVFEKGDLDRIKVNLVDFAVGEFYNSLPSSLNIFGIDMKPTSFINKEELKTVFDGIFTHEEIVKIISGILNYKFEKQFQDFFIWRSN